MPLAKALKEWEAKHGTAASEAKEIALYGGMVLDGKRIFINKLDASLSTLKECECVLGRRAGGGPLAGCPLASV